MNIDQIAQIAHEINKAYCESIGDDSQKDWWNAESWQRDSSIRGVQFAIENPDATPESQHEAWKKDKEKNGWVFGAKKDPDKKEHPCMLPYSELPIEQRTKDHLFRQVVNSLKNFMTE